MSEPSAVANTFYDEMYDADGRPRRKIFAERLKGLTSEDLRHRQKRAESSLLDRGITFAVYGDQAGSEKIWPFDVIPRIIDAAEWQMVENGLKQRIRALNLFIDDVYNEGKILKDKVVPEDMIRSAKTYRPQCQGLKPAKGIWAHITGTDLVRDADGQIYVLEDNLRCPSGVSYVLENREIMKQILPEVFQGSPVAPVEDYPECLLQTLLETAPPHCDTPTAVVLTPGIYNSAYFEHSFLAQQMGIELVQGSDLSVENGRVVMHTTKGPEPVDVIYRRIDDDFLDPKCFREDSCLGVPGLMEVVQAGRVTLANAPGTGIADDKALYTFVPQIIKYYLNEEAILPNVPTYICSDAKDKEYVLANLEKLVVKPTNESGGYGILMGPQSTKEEREKCAAAVKANPRNYIAQPMLTLSTVPTIVDDHTEPRHVDLRPFILCGEDIYVLPGGLTRVALKKGSMIVNSSQGGGSKDTWVLTDNGTCASDQIVPLENAPIQSQSQNQNGSSQSQSQSSE